MPSYNAITEDLSEQSGTLRGQGSIVGDVLIGVATAGTAGIAAKTGTVAKVVRKLKRTPDVPEVSPRTPVGHRGKPINVIPGTNKPTTISGRKYTGQALDRMQERGLTPTVIEDTISRGTPTPSRGGTTVIKTDQAGVVINSAGDVVTVYPQ